MLALRRSCEEGQEALKRKLGWLWGCQGRLPTVICTCPLMMMADRDPEVEAQLMRWLDCGLHRLAAASGQLFAALGIRKPLERSLGPTIKASKV